MNTLRKLLYSTLAVLVLVSFVGCDSDDDDDDPADAFVGTWNLQSIEDTVNGDLTNQLLQIVNSLTIDFDEDGAFELNLDYNEAGEAAGNEDITLTGTYVATETNLNLTINEAQVTPSFPYNFNSNTEVELTQPAAVINAIFNSTLYQGTVTITLVR
jgi:hypothetical protein